MKAPREREKRKKKLFEANIFSIDTIKKENTMKATNHKPEAVTPATYTYVYVYKNPLSVYAYKYGKCENGFGGKRGGMSVCV